MAGYVYRAGDELPVWEAQWNDRNGHHVNLSAATFSAKLVAADGTTVVTKTSGIVGTASGAVTITWAAGELAIAAGSYRLYLVATLGGDDRTFSPDRLPTIGIIAAPA